MQRFATMEPVIPSRDRGNTEQEDTAPMIALDRYVVTDEFFGDPYIDADEGRDAPLRHRYLHGGFARTDTRFNFYDPLTGGGVGCSIHGKPVSAATSTTSVRALGRL